ncbi:MAG: efflux RND transporter periplasmic adaptor subunit [Planctomyces sp.]|nr:efflux RND transporter periplasmic adaptor subunit [Planctomyces sp.]
MAVVVGVIAAGGVLGLVIDRAMTAGDAPQALSPQMDLPGTAVVRRGPLSLELKQRGNVECVRETVLASKVEWSTRLTSIVPEGTLVKAGDIIATLDVSKLLEEYGEELVDVLTAEAALETARQEKRIQEIENRNSLAAAMLAAELARMKLDAYQAAEFPQQVNELERQIAAADDALHTAQESLAFVDRQVTKGFQTAVDLDRARVGLMQRQRAYEDLVEQLRVLRDHTWSRTLRELEGLAEDCQRRLEREHSLAETRRISREMQVDVQQRRLLRQQEQLAWATRMLSYCELRAPHDGQVVYVNDSRDWQNQTGEGMTVRFLQPLVSIPDRSALQVKVRVHESLQRLLAVGLPARIQLDAMPERSLTGSVVSVSRFPLSGRWPNMELREYEAVVRLDESPEDVAPGLSAGVNLIAASKDDALQAPLEAFTEVDDCFLAFVKTGDRIEAREVLLGSSTRDAVEILSGLSAGERLMLKPRETCGAALLAWQERRSPHVLASNDLIAD